MASPHIEAEAGAIAETVLLPGDPLRARYIAERFLESPLQVNGRRNMLAYTGRYRGMPVTVMGGGMGIPSTAIYATELARMHGVRRILRVGTCGGIGGAALGEVVLAQAGSTDSSFNRRQFGGLELAACADFELLCAAVAAARSAGIPARVAHVFSTDAFYGDEPGLLELLHRHRVRGIEMETAGLYGLAMREGFRALSLLAVSDLLPGGEAMPATERERGLDALVQLALDCALASAGRQPPA